MLFQFYYIFMWIINNFGEKLIIKFYKVILCLWRISDIFIDSFVNHKTKEWFCILFSESEHSSIVSHKLKHKISSKKGNTLLMFSNWIQNFFLSFSHRWLSRLKKTLFNENVPHIVCEWKTNRFIVHKCFYEFNLISHSLGFTEKRDCIYFT